MDKTQVILPRITVPTNQVDASMLTELVRQINDVVNAIERDSRNTYHDFIKGQSTFEKKSSGTTLSTMDEGALRFCLSAGTWYAVARLSGTRYYEALTAM
jgi:hypothetical protein